MNRRRGRFGKFVGRAVLGLAATSATVSLVLLAPSVTASPQGDAEDAITATWQKAGGDGSVLGAKQGDIYAVGDGFAQNFASGKIFFTPATGANLVYGPILKKYESLGGPVGSDLGFPTINEVPGLAGPDSRVSIFSASDKPVIFWTPDHGAFVVRGPMNEAWDKLGSSGGVLGVPVADETYDGDVVTQKFTGGQVSWNKVTNGFSTAPPELGQQLADLQVPIDPTAAINMAWRSAGGAGGPLGVKRGEQYPIGSDSIGQDYVGGKIYFTPAIGANAVESDILAKYESLGGPLGSDLGFPTANEADGGIPNSRISTFSASDNPVIFWTLDHGAFVVRGAMQVAWDKLRGAAGQLGAPVGDQTVGGDVVTQKFTGGKIMWNRATNTFSTEPPNLASLLSGLQVPGQNAPSSASSGSSSHSAARSVGGKGFTWNWGWSLAIAILVLLLVLGGILALWIRRRRRQGAVALKTADPEFDRAMGVGYAATGGDHWLTDLDSDIGVSAKGPWSVPDAAPGLAQSEPSNQASIAEKPSAPPAGTRVGFSEEDTDTAPTRVTSDDEAHRGRHAAPELRKAVQDAGQLAGALGGAAQPGVPLPGPVLRPLIQLPLADPYEVPAGYPVKGSVRLGLYYTPASALYGDTLAEIWFASEKAAQVNGFTKAD